MCTGGQLVCRCLGQADYVVIIMCMGGQLVRRCLGQADYVSRVLFFFIHNCLTVVGSAARASKILT